MAIKFESTEENREFYQRLIDGYDQMQRELIETYKNEKVDTEEELRKRLEIKNCVIVQCDKRMGMSMFKLETMRKADQKLMKQTDDSTILFTGVNSFLD